MSKWINLRALSIIFIFSLTLACQKTQAQKKNRPNIIFIMSDDHAYQAISAYDTSLIQTPNIDRIAKEGMLFTNASVTNSICAPSRAVILTGKHSHINGKIDNSFPFDTTNVTFPQLLQAAGYQTAMFGKLHFGNNPKGFDEFKILPGQGDYYNPEFITKKGDTTVTGYVTDIITDLTLDWFENRRDEKKPFMLMYMHKAPHREWLPAERHFPEFTKNQYPEPKTLFDDFSGRGKASKEAEMNILKDMNWTGDSKLFPETIDELGITEKSDWGLMKYQTNIARMTEEQRNNWLKTYAPINEQFIASFPDMDSIALMKWRFQRYMQDYLGTVAAVDENVGRLLDYLEENGLTENTLIVYTSDQGFYLGEHGWFDKRFMYEESFRTPLLMKWDGVIKPESRSDELVQNLDFAQTFLEASGVDVPSDMQGESLLPLISGETDQLNRKEVYYHFYEFPREHRVKMHYGIATKQYKLIHFYYDIDEWELYDRLADPNEMHNLIENPDYKKVIIELKWRLHQLREKYQDSDDLDQKYIQLYENNF